mgnify:CR=1 FL=1
MLSTASWISSQGPAKASTLDWSRFCSVPMLARMGVMDFVNELGAKNIFCTVWEVINEIVSQPG